MKNNTNENKLIKFEFKHDKKNKGYQVLAFKNECIEVIIRDNSKTDKSYKIIIEEV